MQTSELMKAKLIKDNLENTISKETIRSLFSLEQTGEQEWRIAKSPDIPILEGATYYQGKVRANFFRGQLYDTRDRTPIRVIIATDQISTHDMVRGTIPFKGQILTAISDEMLNYTGGSIKNSQLYTFGHAVIAENCKPIDFEVVLRKYMAKSTTETSLYHHYVNLGKREFCGHKLPDDLSANCMLPYIMDTPSTKIREASGGHDESVAPEYLFKQGIVTPEEYAHIRNATIEDFGRISAILEQKGIIIADTKFEIGKNSRGKIVYIDEVLTPDASRFWIAKDYEMKISAGQEPTSYSKQIARDIGKVGEKYTDEQRIIIGRRFIETYEHIMEKDFEPDLRPAREAIIEDMNSMFSQAYNFTYLPDIMPKL